MLTQQRGRPMKLFESLYSVKRYLKDNKYRYLECHSHKEDIFKMYRKGSRIVCITPYRQNYEHTKYKLQVIK